MRRTRAKSHEPAPRAAAPCRAGLGRRALRLWQQRRGHGVRRWIARGRQFLVLGRRRATHLHRRRCHAQERLFRRHARAHSVFHRRLFLQRPQRPARGLPLRPGPAGKPARGRDRSLYRRPQHPARPAAGLRCGHRPFRLPRRLAPAVPGRRRPADRRQPGVQPGRQLPASERHRYRQRRRAAGLLHPHHRRRAVAGHGVALAGRAEHRRRGKPALCLQHLPGLRVDLAVPQPDDSPRRLFHRQQPADGCTACRDRAGHHRPDLRQQQRRLAPLRLAGAELRPGPGLPDHEHPAQFQPERRRHVPAARPEHRPADRPRQQAADPG